MIDGQIRYPSVDKPWLKYYEKVEGIKPKNCSIYEYLHTSNEGNLNAQALMYFNKTITYKELLEKIEKCASALYSMGVRKGDIVTIQALTMPQVVILFYALGYLGAVSNLLYITATEQEIHDNLRLTNSKMYITIDSVFSKVAEAIKDTSVKNIILLNVGDEADSFTKFVTGLKKVKIDKENRSVFSWADLLKHNTNTVVENTDSSLPVAMVYTSGTTGKSKAVVLNHENINSLVIQYKKTKIQFKNGERFMNAIPIFVAYGLVFGVHVPLCLGLTDVLCIDPSPSSVGKSYAKYLPEYLIQGVAGITNVMNNPKLKKKDLSFVKVIGVGGDAVPDSFVQEVNVWLKQHNANIQLVIGYGMTEVAATVVSSTPLVNKFGTVGIPLPDTVVKIVKPETSEELDYDEVGEICFHAPTMMTEYYNQPEETENIIRKHDDGLLWIHSGDLGSIDSDGFVTIKGRIKRMIGVWHNGVYHKVVPKEIEDEIVKFDDVKEVCIIGRKIDASNNIIEAFLVTGDDVNFESLVKTIKNSIKDNMEEWKCPHKFSQIETLPRNTVGKVDWKKLEEAGD